MWLSYSSVPQYTAHFYRITLDEVNWFSEIFFVVAVVMGLITIVILDVVGLRASVSLHFEIHTLDYLSQSHVRWSQ